MRVMLMLSDREEISRGLAEGLQYKEIASRLGRDPSVISRDVARHGGRASYRAVAADRMACAAGERPKVFAVERCRGWPRWCAGSCAAAGRGGVPAAAPRLVPGLDRGPVAH